MTNKLERIMDNHASGMSHEELLRIEEEITERIHEAKQRSRDSVENTLTALGEIEFVTSISETKPDAKSDREGIDLRVNFQSKDAGDLFKKEINLQIVYVQVKSSEDSVLAFINDFGKSLKERVFTLTEKKLIVINGQSEKEDIKDSFISQLEKIYLHAAKSKN